ncbi:MAG: chaperone NapD [Cocleimonas sp.]|nr:chaperone NapD [Cocleimonas sp.]
MSIYSLVVHTRPEDIESVSTALGKKQGVEVHGANEKGKIVVSLDHPDRGYCSDTIMSFHAIEGVLNSSLIYEYFIDDKDSQVITESRQTTTTEAS